MRDLLTVEQRNIRRLAKIHKLKRENKVLGARRKSYYKEVKAWFGQYGNTGNAHALLWLEKINKTSEKIGKNSAKIQRLRTLINQDKAWESRPRLLDPRKIVYVE